MEDGCDNYCSVCAKDMMLCECVEAGESALNDLLSRIKPYIPDAKQPKCDITPPCKLCGWGPNKAIHRNHNLIGKGPYHDFER